MSTYPIIVWGTPSVIHREPYIEVTAFLEHLPRPRQRTMNARYYSCPACRQRWHGHFKALHNMLVHVCTQHMNSHREYIAVENPKLSSSWTCSFCHYMGRRLVSMDVARHWYYDYKRHWQALEGVLMLQALGQD